MFTNRKVCKPLLAGKTGAQVVTSLHEPTFSFLPSVWHGHVSPTNIGRTRLYLEREMEKYLRRSTHLVIIRRLPSAHRGDLLPLYSRSFNHTLPFPLIIKQRAALDIPKRYNAHRNSNTAISTVKTRLSFTYVRAYCYLTLYVLRRKNLILHYVLVEFILHETLLFKNVHSCKWPSICILKIKERTLNSILTKHCLQLHLCKTSRSYSTFLSLIIVLRMRKKPTNHLIVFPIHAYRKTGWKNAVT